MKKEKNYQGNNVVESYFAGNSGLVISSFIKTHDEKRKLILKADDMSTQDKLNELDNNDRRLLSLLLGTGIGIGLAITLVKSGDINKLADYITKYKPIAA